MTERNLSNEAKAAVFAQSTDEVFIVLLTINHETFTQPARLSNDPKEVLPIAGVRGVVSNGEEYIYLPFSFEAPAQDDTGVSKARLSIDNINRELISAVRNATSSLSIDIAIVRGSDPDTLEVTMLGFKLDSIKYDAFTISGNLSLEYFDLEPFPSQRFTPSSFQGLF